MMLCSSPATGGMTVRQRVSSGIGEMGLAECQATFDPVDIMKSVSELNQTSESCASFLSMSSNLSQKSQNPSEDSDDEATTSQTPASRKEKSLGKLCRRFLIAMGQALANVKERKCHGGRLPCECRGDCATVKNCKCREIHLETVAKEMKTEKRRIYDIVNVMEALDAMSKGNKSYYQWNTLSKLPIIMAKLEEEARDEGLKKRVADVQDAMGKLHEIGLSGSAPPQVEEVKESPVDSPNDKLGSFLKEKGNKNSLALLCSRFLMVILSDPKDRKVSLDVASTVLIKETEREGFDPPSRSRCRRLYDIANVLVALGLVKKAHYMFGTKKIPMFQYCGPEPKATPEEADKSMRDFVKASNLAIPYDDTWMAIFGTGIRPSSTPLLPPLNFKFAAIKPQTERRVFGELPITGHPHMVKQEPSYGCYEEEDKENNPPMIKMERLEVENDENSCENGLPRPKPSASANENEPPAKRFCPSAGLSTLQPAPAYPSLLPTVNNLAWFQFALLQQRAMFPQPHPVQMPGTSSPKAFKPPAKLYSNPLGPKTNLFKSNQF
ncbi:unnamed protein product [Bursaphelenchus xylophilus]|uniref:(pine wood nematode) hypothetical protein n=1 Tax=Bursaphelenchus xylophilus TaxID=6326 RepID=A0A1I7SV65_BURXY|nr:unnamed protein product [Bursaphelenchus xylophilus]CAG9100961.1 unnamed protein product [Bursaphelenchus xylophilus]